MSKLAQLASLFKNVARQETRSDKSDIYFAAQVFLGGDDDRAGEITYQDIFESCKKLVKR